MSSVRDIHKKAMALINESMTKENVHEKNVLLKEALSLEVEAAMTLYNKFDAEPTRSVLFRSAATIAFNVNDFETCERMIFCGLSSSKIPIETKEELLTVKENLDEMKNLEINNSYEFSYIQLLRRCAINIRLKPATPKYSHAVYIDDILSVLKAIKVSFSNYLAVSFRKHFNDERFGDSNKLIAMLNKEFPLLYVNAKFRSFGASLSTDATIQTNNNYPTDINNWKKTLFEEFKNDVVYCNYNSENEIKTIREKFSDEERHFIYKGLIEIYNSKKFNVSFTDETFEETIKEVIPISKKQREVILPKLSLKQVLEEKKLVRTFALSSDKSGVKKSEIIFSEELSFAEFKHQMNSLCFDKETIDFNQTLEVTIVYENNCFSIDYPDFGVNVVENGFEECLISFSQMVIKQYKNVNGIKAEDLDIETALIKENLLKSISFYTK
jgi:hypothetical protein